MMLLGALIIFSLFLLNLYYIKVTRFNDQEEHIKRGSKKINQFDIAAFGSSYCRYAFNFESTNLSGYNFGIVAQFLYYTNLMIRSFRKTYKDNALIIIVLPSLVFAEPGKGKYAPSRYVRFVKKSLLKDEYSIFRKILLSYMPLFVPSIGNFKQCLCRIFANENKEYFNLRYNKLSEKENVATAKQRCKDWCDEFGLNDTVSVNVPESLESKFEQSISILKDIIDYCLEEKLRPILVVTPVSDIMRKRCSKAFLDRVLYSNIKKANIQNIPFLDYYEDKRFSDISLYANNADFLNARGRELFTKVVLQDINRMYER